MSTSRIQRREFLKQSSTAAVAGATALTSVDQVLAGSAASQDFEHEQFRDLVGDKFLVHRWPDDAICEELVLVQATAYGLSRQDARPAHVRQRPFSLLFAARKGVSLENAIHSVEHRRLGPLKLSLSRTRRDTHPNQDVYEAVFG